MTKPTISFHNVETNEQIVREMTEIEFAQFEKDQAIVNNQAAKDAAKQAVLDKLGLSSDEVAALLG